MVVQVTPPGIQNLGWRFWIIWAVICFSFIPITYFFYPETAGRTLEDIDRYFEEKPGIIVAFDKGKLPTKPCGLYGTLDMMLTGCRWTRRLLDRRAARPWRIFNTLSISLRNEPSQCLYRHESCQRSLDNRRWMKLRAYGWNSGHVQPAQENDEIP
jgi:hypothetical protein